ncbi:polyketide cyclase/dehydrase/lipid transport protein [Amycolatopsis echigonensis]|uniref:Polyketide cyclase/dehydrase/lipid transport protein n=1 Tax=Amycolatopsis echigonensis TaxID=2576905 RepID=A0A2N3X1H8_9PSEU|nr:SRPBCC family protein [Amycolatopsis niigatensis]PKV99977.1 polyketide cyclase/dehydrase/lipid transport protein [Amycolatopsis niigatensis]
MASVSVTQALPVDPQKAWDALSDLAGWENWLSIHQNWKSELPTEVTEGTRVTEVVSVMGMANKIEWTITHVDAPHTVTIAGTGMAGVKVEFTLSVAPAEGGSTAQIDASFTGTMIVGPIGKAVAKNTQADLDGSLAKFAQLVAA